MLLAERIVEQLELAGQLAVWQPMHRVEQIRPRAQLVVEPSGATCNFRLSILLQIDGGGV